tara:strand:- start:25132 stop:25686 length:555 start_codon:yes stop_codon:yes gene_type:complete
MPRCKVCKDKFEARFFLQKTCIKPKCLAEWQKVEREAKADKAHTKRKKEFRDNDKPLRDKEAQKSFNAFIRMSDDKRPCISCNEFRAETAVSSGSNWHAGHYKTRGARPSLRFEEDNCHKQCAHCNNFLSGNIENYRINLIKKIGLDRVEWLEGTHEPKKYTCSELKEIELLYKNKLKELTSKE